MLYDSKKKQGKITGNWSNQMIIINIKVLILLFTFLNHSFAEKIFQSPLDVSIKLKRKTCKCPAISLTKQRPSRDHPAISILHTRTRIFLTRDSRNAKLCTNFARENSQCKKPPGKSPSSFPKRVS